MERREKGKKNLKNKAYDIIRDKIIRCEYMPGQFLNELELKTVIGASRTPIREACSKLEQEGFLSIFPKRGIMVRDITLAEVNAIYEIRCMLEPYVILTYGHLLLPGALQEMQRKMSVSSLETDFVNEYDVDNDFHGMLIRASGNPYIIELMNKIFGQNHRLRILSGQLLQHRIKDTVREHDLILRWLAEQKLEKAAEAMRIHLENARKAAVEVMAVSKGWQ